MWCVFYHKVLWGARQCYHVLHNMHYRCGLCGSKLVCECIPTLAVPQAQKCVPVAMSCAMLCADAASMDALMACYGQMDAVRMPWGRTDGRARPAQAG
jgi:hypothetical protein